MRFSGVKPRERRRERKGRATRPLSRSYGNARRNGWEHIRVIVVIVCDCDVHAKELNDCVDFTSGHKLVVLDKDAA